MIRLSRLTIAVPSVFAVGLFVVLLASAQQSPTFPGQTPVPGDVVTEVINQNVERPDTRQSYEQPVAAPEAPRTDIPTRPGQQPMQPQRGMVRPLTSTKTPPAVSGQRGPFEPILQRPVEYTPVPEEGQSLTAQMLATPMPCSEFLDTLHVSTGWNIVATPEANSVQLTFAIKDMTPSQALEVLRFHHVYYEFDPETKFLYVMTRDQHLEREYGTAETREFVVKYADLNDMNASLSTLLSVNGRMIPDPRTGRLLITDTPDNLDVIADALTRLDVPLEPKNFYLKHVDAESMAESIQTLLSDRGVAFSDPRMNVVSVTDLPSRMQQIETLVEALDVAQESHTWTLNYVEPKDVAERIETLVPEEMGTIATDELVHQITVTAIPERISQIDALIKEWDVPRRQVQIEVFLVLANTQIERNFGIDWSYFDEINGNPLAISSGGSTPDVTARPESGQLFQLGTLPIPIYDFNPFTGEINEDINGNPIIEGFRGNNVAVVLEYLDQQGDATILSRPRVTVYDGEKATFQNTEERPYQEGGYSQYGGVSTDPNFNRLIPLSVRFIEVGTILKVMPRINEESKILMEIDVEDSTAEEVTVTTGDQQSTIPQKAKASAQTRVLVHDAQTVVIGGLRNVSTNDSVDKVPFLGDVPFVGRLFKSTEKNHRHRELLVFITPTIVDPYTSRESARLSAYDHDIEEQIRTDRKNLFRRSLERFTKKENEIVVSIGQSGDVMLDGRPSTLDAVQTTIRTHRNPSAMTVVILMHPLAPADLADGVMAGAEQAGMKVVREKHAYPFVPAFRRASGTGEARQE